MTLGKRVKELRESKNMSQADLAKAIGVERSYVGHIETGRVQMPSKDILKALARELDTNTEDFLIAASYISPIKGAELDLSDPTLDLYLRHRNDLNEHDRRIIETIIREADKRKYEGG